MYIYIYICICIHIYTLSIYLSPSLSLSLSLYIYIYIYTHTHKKESPPSAPMRTSAASAVAAASIRRPGWVGLKGVPTTKHLNNIIYTLLSHLNKILWSDPPFRIPICGTVTDANLLTPSQSKQTPKLHFEVTLR